MAIAKINSIYKIGIPCSSGLRSWLNFFSKLLLVKNLKSGALSRQKRVKHEREQGPAGDPYLRYTKQSVVFEKFWRIFNNLYKKLWM